MAVWFDEEGFTIGDGGIFATSPRGENYKVHEFPAMPVAVVRSTGEGGEVSSFVRVKLRSVYGDDAEILVPLEDFTSWGGKHPMTDAGWPAPPQGSKRGKVAEALLCALRHSDVKRLEGFGLCGWVRPDLHLRPGNPLYTGMLPERTKTAGSKAEWAAVLSEMATDSPLFALALACAFGAYLRGVVPMSAEISHILHLHGEARRGKTTILAALASIEGQANKGGPLLDSSSTNVGVEFLLSACNHGFLCVDELDDVLRKEGGAARLMYWANGGGRVKGDAFGGMKQGKTWNACLIGTGNVPLSRLFASDMKADALASRVFEFDIMDADLCTFRRRDLAAKWLPTLAENYGHGRPAACGLVMADPSRWKDVYNEVFYDLTMRGEWRHFDQERRFAEFLALAFAGAELAGAVLGPAVSTAAQAALETWRERHKKEDGDDLESADLAAIGKISAMRQFISMSAGRFCWEGYAWHDDAMQQQGQARHLSEEARRMGAYGIVKVSRPMQSHDDIEGEVLLSPKGEDAMKRDGGLAAPELTQAARRLGLLKTQGDRDHVKLGKATAGLLGSSRALVVELRDVSIEDIRQARPKTHQEPVAKSSGAFGKEFADEANKDWLESLPSMEGDAGAPDLLDNIEDSIPF